MDRPGTDRTADALAGDPDALDWLVARWMPQVYAWCLRLGAPDPQDAATDVLILLLRRHRRINGADHLPGWLLTSCRHVVSNRRRLAWWRGWLPGFALERLPARDPPFEDARRVHEVLAGLSVADREVLVLCYVEERSIAEAAALLQIPEGTVKSRLSAARARFGAAWGGDE